MTEYRKAWQNFHRGVYYLQTLFGYVFSIVFNQLFYYSYLNKQLDKELNSSDSPFGNQDQDQIIYGKDVGIVCFY